MTHDIAKVKDILRSLSDDASLVPERLQGWWSGYLEKHVDHYLNVISCLDAADMASPLLEIGSVPGQLTVLLCKLGYDVHGVDIDPARTARFWAKHGLEVAKVDVEQARLPFEDKTFGVVLFTEILEHLRINPLYALREAHRVLAPGGKIVLSTPNITPLIRLRFLLGTGYQGNPVEEFSKLEKIGHMGHIRLYDLPEIKDMLAHVGFTVRSSTYKGNRVFRGWKERAFSMLYPRKEQLRRYVFVNATKS